jgi:Arc/MetJ family transcription regulator
VVYSGVVGRTQIYLHDEELALLERQARLTGASRSELVRRAIRSTYGETLTREERLEALRRSAGALKNFPMTGAEYVDSIRGDLNDRLRRLGFE